MLHQLIVGIFLLSLLSACQKVDTFFLGEDNVQAPAALVDFKEEFALEKKWQQRVGSGVGRLYLDLQPTIVGSQIITVDPNGLLRVTDRNTGHPLWQLKLHAPLSTPVGVWQHYLLVGASNGEVLAVDMQEKRLLWRIDVGNEILARPIISGKQVFVKTVDSQVVALSLREGKPLWRYYHDISGLVLHASSAVAVHPSEQYVVVGFADGQLVVLQRNTGQVLWRRMLTKPQGRTPAQRMVGIAARPVIIDDIVYVASYQGQLAALSLRTGEFVWQHPLSVYCGIKIVNDRIFVNNAEGHVFAFDRLSGKKLWQQKQLQARGLTAPAIAGDKLVVGDAKGYVHYLAMKDGRLLARTRTGFSAILATPIVRGKNLYVLNARGLLFRYQVAS